MTEADDLNDVPAEVWLAYERQAKDVMNLWAPDVPALQTAVHAAMIRAWRSGRAVAAEPVAVKPLEWVEEISDLWWSADHYRVESCKGGGFSARVNDPKSRTFRILNFGVSFEEAKAAAQADYEARIRSALTLPA